MKADFKLNAAKLERSKKGIELKDLFKKFDSNHDGKLSRDEIAYGFKVQT